MTRLARCESSPSFPAIVVRSAAKVLGMMRGPGRAPEGFLKGHETGARRSPQGRGTSFPSTFFLTSLPPHTHHHLPPQPPTPPLWERVPWRPWDTSATFLATRFQPVDLTDTGHHLPLAMAGDEVKDPAVAALCHDVSNMMRSRGQVPNIFMNRPVTVQLHVHKERGMVCLRPVKAGAHILGPVHIAYATDAF